MFGSVLSNPNQLHQKVLLRNHVFYTLRLVRRIALTEVSVLRLEILFSVVLLKLFNYRLFENP